MSGAKLTVKEVARMLGISPHAVRYYDGQGLVPGVVRDESDTRLFGDEAVGRLRAIAALREAGMPLSDVRRYFVFPEGSPERAALLEPRIARLGACLAELESMRMGKRTEKR